jgi:putative SOS response-associated peptidase YedK
MIACQELTPKLSRQDDGENGGYNARHGLAKRFDQDPSVMCGRFTLRTSAAEVAKTFQLQSTLFDLAPRYNIAPTQQIAAVRANAETEARELVFLRWGLVPSWADDLAIGNRMINARAETLAEKPSFRKAFSARRCLIVADGFYEWQKQGAKKQPYYIGMKDQRPFAFAGIWERNNRTGSEIETCTIITTTANDLMAPLHDRMPVILPASSYDLWLDVAVQEVERLTPLLQSYPSNEMQAVPVSTLVNNPRNESPECLTSLS